MHRTKQTTSRTTRPLLAPDVDGRVLEFCEPLELGRCAAVSTGLRAAADIAWKPVATTRFPLLASIARAAGGKFGYASACRSQLKCLKKGVAPPCIRELIRSHSWHRNEGELASELANIVVTYALHTVRERPARPHNTSSTGYVDATYRPPRYEDEPPFFAWSGRLSVRTPNLWTSDQIPTKVREWLDAIEPWRGTRATFNLSPGSFPMERNVYLRIFLTEDSKTILLYDGAASSERDEVLEFDRKVAPLSPRLTDDFPHMIDPRDVCLSIRPSIELATGRFIP
jgi:hypothetical protein